MTGGYASANSLPSLQLVLKPSTLVGIGKAGADPVVPMQLPVIDSAE